MKSCNKCLLPETHETIEFDKNGTGNICNQHKFKKEKLIGIAKKRNLKK